MCHLATWNSSFQWDFSYIIFGVALISLVYNFWIGFLMPYKKSIYICIAIACLKYFTCIVINLLHKICQWFNVHFVVGLRTGLKSPKTPTNVGRPKQILFLNTHVHELRIITPILMRFFNKKLSRWIAKRTNILLNADTDDALLFPQ